MNRGSPIDRSEWFDLMHPERPRVSGPVPQPKSPTYSLRCYCGIEIELGTKEGSVSTCVCGATARNQGRITLEPADA